MQLTSTEIGNVLTRAGGFLKTVASHSLQPYRGCPLGASLCGVGCYVRQSAWVTRGREWGSFLEARMNAAESYLRHVSRERAWGRENRGGFGVFLSSATEPFPPQERRFRVTRSVLAAMCEVPPDFLVIQTHSPRVTEYLDLYRDLAARCRLRFHISIETDRPRLPGLPPPASPPEARFRAAGELRRAGLETLITISPLLPIRDPEAFFRRVAEVADGVVIDHFIEGDGTPDGRRTRATALPAAMAAAEPRSTELAYREEMIAVARQILPGRVGRSIDGFAARFLP